MKNIKRILYSLAFLLLFGQGSVQAQMPNFFGRSSEPAKPAITAPVASDAAVVKPPTRPTASMSTSLYDPMMDNHLKAPPAGQEIGVFGMHGKV